MSDFAAVGGLGDSLPGPVVSTTSSIARPLIFLALRIITRGPEKIFSCLGKQPDGHRDIIPPALRRVPFNFEIFDS
jgi:hypothetical protein